MEFKDAIKAGFDNYANFNGRASRSEFWFWQLFYFLVMLGAGILDGIIGMGVIGLVVMLAFLVPNVSIGVRRLHDVDRSGWWLLISLIPLIGIIVLIVWWVTKGTDGANRFGNDPLFTIN